ncbi:hypothetical protein Pcinc_017706 [Petrolisthes cinctipes]|uniref:Chitin-binding type-4 domain-containing protein n=1 Tax=Petrolisthes cinctipes TaxID=88211 RepID=A0AAE1FQ53_PETCI|nr:hypothetical protein Pcinc_017706 [Petrolisthes cinctipes]
MALSVVGVVLCALVSVVSSHGYLSSPASRNSAWRFGFGTQTNYNDNELYCGGREVMHSQNQGRCGVCGDNWRLSEPRPHERGGVYGKGVITAQYRSGQVIPITIRISANHGGWFEFRLCNNNNPRARDSQQCLNKQLLTFADGSRGTRYNLSRSLRGDVTVHVQLPPRLSCTNCVLQWTWVVGNTWGICSDGRGKVGCGPQETFVNCADIQISPKRGFQKPTTTFNKNKNNFLYPRVSLVASVWFAGLVATIERDLKEDVLQTVVFLQRESIPDQDLFIRGGISESLRPPGCSSIVESDPCAIDMNTNLLGTIQHYEKYNAWRVGDTRLDWSGAQPGQDVYQGIPAEGTPLVWTTNNVLSPGYQELNTFGEHYWMVSMDMNCTQTEAGWFEVKGYLTNTMDNWETDIAQVGG